MKKLIEKCTAWADGEHLFTPGHHRPWWQSPFRALRGFRAIDTDDHRTMAKRCRCGLVVNVTKTDGGKVPQGPAILLPGESLPEDIAAGSAEFERMNRALALDLFKPK